MQNADHSKCTCVVCKEEFFAAPYDYDAFMARGHAFVIRVRHSPGWRCGHCGAFVCKKDKKVLKSGRRFLFAEYKGPCPSCGEAFFPAAIQYTLEQLTNMVVADTQAVIDRLEKRARAGRSSKSKSHEDLLQMLRDYGPAIVDLRLAELQTQVSLGRRHLEESHIKWFGWLVDVEADWLLKDERIWPALLAVAQVGSEPQRLLVAQALVKIDRAAGSDQVIPVLLELMDRNKYRSRGTSEALAYPETLFGLLESYLPDDRVVQAFVSYLSGHCLHIKAKAAETLRTVPDDDRVIEALVKALDNTASPSKRDTDGLAGMMETEGPSISRRARDSLKALTGQDLGPRSKHWQEWLVSRKAERT